MDVKCVVRGVQKNIVFINVDTGEQRDFIDDVKNSQIAKNKRECEDTWKQGKNRGGPFVKWSRG